MRQWHFPKQISSTNPSTQVPLSLNLTQMPTSYYKAASHLFFNLGLGFFLGKNVIFPFPLRGHLDGYLVPF